MSQENENVAEEIQQEEIVPPQEGQETQDQSPEESPKEEKVTYSKDENLIRLRASKEQLEIENRELRAEKAYQAKIQESSQEEESLGIEDADLAEGKHVNQLDKKIRKLEKLQKQFQQSYEQEKVASIPDRLKTKFEDFDQVVTQENVEKLKMSEPELYASITAGKDLYAKGVSAYKTLLAMGIVKKDSYKSQKEEVHNNHKKPVSTQAIRGQGALSEANMFSKGLTPELKKQLNKEMEQAAKAR